MFAERRFWLNATIIIVEFVMILVEEGDGGTCGSIKNDAIKKTRKVCTKTVTLVSCLSKKGSIIGIASCVSPLEDSQA